MEGVFAVHVGSARVHWAVATGSAGLLEEMYVRNASRWHPLTRDTIDAVRAGLAPRALLAVWPPLSPDVDAVLATLPAGGLVEGVWQEESGRVRSAVVLEDEFPQLTAWMAGARAAALVSMDADERIPLFTAVMPDEDGVVRARWRTDPSPSDRNWAFLKTLHRGQVVTGTVTRIAESGAAFVDIGGFEGISRASDALSVGQEVDAEVLDVDPVRERVSLSLKAPR